MESEKPNNKSVSIHNRQAAAEGDIIVRQGDKGNTAYLIQSGKVKIYIEDGGKVKDLAVLEAGAIFGEMALVIDEPRAASAVALENTTLIKITRPMMIEKLGKSDVTIRALIKMMIDRIKQANLASFDNNKTVAGLIENIDEVYAAVEGRLQGPQKKTLERDVKPAMDAFVKAIVDFDKRYSD